MEFFDKFIMPWVKERLEKLVNAKFAKVTYTEAIELLKKICKARKYSCIIREYMIKYKLRITSI
jgi:asparaginyl-tRNA synthetase